MLGRAFERLLIELDGHRYHCLLQVAAMSVQQSIIFDVSEVAEGGRDVGLELDLDALDFSFIDVLLREIVRF